jgi:hypothetical protein
MDTKMETKVVGANIDTFIGNARITGDFPDALAEQLEDLKRRSQEAEEDLPTSWQFAGEALFIKPHGAGRQWRWILHSPSIHVDVGLGRLTHIVAKARLPPPFCGSMKSALRSPFSTDSSLTFCRLRLPSR